MVSFCFGLLTLALNGEEWSVFASVVLLNGKNLLDTGSWVGTGATVEWIAKRLILARARNGRLVQLLGVFTK